jgi:hypothetical protein
MVVKIGLDLLFTLILGAVVFFVRVGQWHAYLGRRLRGMFLSSADTWVILIDAKKIREHGFRLSAKFREDDVEAERSYPPLFFYLLAIVPERFTKALVKHGPALSDAFIASILTISTMLITNNVMLAALAAVVYLSSPMIFQQTFCFCIRPLSIFLVSLIYIFSLNFSWSNFIVISVLVALVLLLHKFATQVVFFTSLAFLFLLRFDYLFSVAVGFIIAVGISGGFYLKVLKAHVAHLKSNYLKQYLHGRTHNAARKTIALAVYCPWILFFVFSAFAIWKNILSASLAFTFAWIITLGLLAVLTNFGKFRIIGEGWRYLGYMVFPLAYWAGYAVKYTPSLLWVCIAFAIIGFSAGYFYVFRLFSRHKKSLVSEADIEIFKQLSTIEGKSIAALPKDFTYPISYFSGKDFAAKLELDFEERAADLADIIVVNKECAEVQLYEKLRKRGYTVKLETDKWIAYAR